MPENRGPGQGGASRDAKDGRRSDSRQKPPAATVVVRYGRMNHVGEFHLPRNVERPGCGSQVVVQTDRGVELGEPIGLTCSTCPGAVSRERMRSYVKNSGPDFLRFQAGRVLRQATPEDLIEQRHIEAQKQKKLETCEALLERHGLEMKLVDCEHVLGGERVVFYFTAESRVDFRALVRDLAEEFQTRIEMRQIGARDEARLVADYETCGRECCCKNFLKMLKPVSMRMAKMQKATLDPSKVSGRCGRLKCCLRFEQETYEELERGMPRVGQRVNTTEGEGVVVDRQILTQLLQVEGDVGQSFVVGREQVLAPGQGPPAEEEPSGKGVQGRAGSEWGPLESEPASRPTVAGPVQDRPAGDLPQEEPSRPDGPRAERSGGREDGAEAPPSKSGRRRRRRRGRRGRGRRRGGE